MKDLINLEVVKNALSYIGRVPRPEIIFEDEFKIVTRCLIVYRFIKNLDKGGERSEKSMANTRIGSA
jgi:asparagine synthase (glutamine-hydrolysing)